MYLLDTNIVSEFRKKSRMNKGVQAFFSEAAKDNQQLYLSVITIGELRRVVEIVEIMSRQTSWKYGLAKLRQNIAVTSFLSPN